MIYSITENGDRLKLSDLLKNMNKSETKNDQKYILNKIMFKRQN